MISELDAKELLNNFVQIRDKYRANGTDDLKKQYQKQVSVCSAEFDYIVQNKVRKYRSFSNYEDLMQDGRIALMQALESYQLGKGSWYWWCNQYVKTRISREANAHSTIRMSLKKSRKNAPHKVQMPLIIDHNTAELDSMIIQDRIVMHSFIMKLPAIQRKLIQKFYEFDGWEALGTLGKELGMSAKECSQELNKAKATIKENILSKNSSQENGSIFNIY